MRFSGFLTLLGVFMVLFSYGAQAHTLPESTPKTSVPDFERFRLENSKDMNHSQWHHDRWQPSDWINSSDGSAKDVITGLRRGGIITDQYEDDGTPILEVGEGFMRLSSIDKRRVAAFVDSYYNITASKENGMFFIYHQKLDKPIGMYTKYGLQIQ